MAKSAAGPHVPWIETPLIKSQSLSKAAGCQIFLKLENLQPSGSFKCRGIGNYLVAKANMGQQNGHCTTLSNRRVHFYCSSGGNAGLACVHGALTLGCEATIVVPLTTTRYMVDKLRQAGATDVIQKGVSWQEADDYLTETLMVDARARGENAVYVPPFDAQEIWDGYAGIVHEIVRQLPDAATHHPDIREGQAFSSVPRKPCNGGGGGGGGGGGQRVVPIDAMVCSVGGGGLFAGLMQGVDETKLQGTKIVAVETKGADSLSQAVQRGCETTLPAITSLATSLGARRVCTRAFEYGLRKETVVTAVLSDSDAIRACKRFLDEERFLVELACGVCPAVCYNGQLADLVPGLNENSVVVLVVCGGSNMSFDILDTYLTTAESPSVA